jgi:asparagine synthase (glutamine-hydrolysing)
MCGILGIESKSKPLNVEFVQSLAQTLSHRGKDNQSVWITENNSVALAHIRLSLIDLSEQGNQPMANETNNMFLSFNGEIYNYKELRRQLMDLGHTFKSNSDAEVVLHGYEEWNVQVLQRLNGMFAFIIYDTLSHRFFIARDRIGIKPLYYSTFNHIFIAASEIKAIIKHPDFSKQINMTSFSEYFTYRYVPSPNTIYKNIYKLPPATYLLVEHGNITEPVTYWELSFNETHKTFSDMVGTVHQKLSESVKSHFQSDVPVGIFLSGGLDSSTVALLSKENNFNPHAFTIGFESWKNSEHHAAKRIADTLHIPYHEKILGIDTLNNITSSVFNYDEPIADISVVPTYEISRFASGYVKTILSGEGGDELFAGYTWHKKLMQNLTFFSLAKRVSPNLHVNYYASAMAMGLFDKPELQRLINAPFHKDIPDDVFHFYRKYYNKNLHPLQATQYLDLKTFLAELVLTKVDRASMAHTLEVRVPFLNHELVEFMFSLHPDVYYKKNTQKFILQEILKAQIPAEILQRPKQGFVGPDKAYMETTLYEQFLRKSQLATDGLLNQQAIHNYLSVHDHWRLWKILIMEIWYRYWMMEVNSEINLRMR